MKFPRIVFGAGYIKLWQESRRENCRLRLELREWQGKLLQKVNVTPLFTPPPKPVEPVRRPPIGMTDKRRYLAETPEPNHVPTAEEILASAAERNGHK